MKRLFVLTICLLFLVVSCQSADEPVQDATDTESVAENETAVSESEAVQETAPEVAEETESAAETAVPDPTNVPPTLTPPPPPPEPESESTDPGVDTAIEPDATQPDSNVVTIEASDGLSIQATFAYPGGLSPFPGVMLLHMLGSDRNVWDETGFLATLLQNGYAVIAVDMRGHGETGGSQDWALSRDDLQRVYDFFISQEQVDETQTAVIGASIGSNMSLVTAVNKPEINTVVLLSPGLDYRGVTTDDQISLYGDRPILIVASEEDTYSADSSQQLFDAASGEKELELYNGAGHGTNMFANEAGLPDLMLDWLRQHISN